MKQVWYCERCKQVGEVEYEEHADVLSVVYKIRDAHTNCHLDHRLRIATREAFEHNKVPDWVLVKMLDQAIGR